MKNKVTLFGLVLSTMLFSTFLYASPLSPTLQKLMDSQETRTDSVSKSTEEWKKILSPQEFNVLRNHATDRPFSGSMYQTEAKGQYFCKACGLLLFNSDSKFDAGCGWPSFFEAASKDSVKYLRDDSLGPTRVEIRCARCDSHLGHVFDDGPQPTHLRYCLNESAIKFEEGLPK